MKNGAVSTVSRSLSLDSQQLSVLRWQVRHLPPPLVAISHLLLLKQSRGGEQHSDKARGRGTPQQHLKAGWAARR